MKKKILDQEVLKKLKKYSAATAAVAFIGSTGNAQIVYTDVNPDETLNSFPSNYQIDFDSDGNFDIDISMDVVTSVYSSYTYSYFGIHARPIGSNTSVVASSSYVAVLNTSNLISSANSFVYSGWGLGLVTGNSSSTWGNWDAPTIDDKFIGVKFDISGETHYGWIRVSTTFTDYQNMSVTIKDFAYQSIADSSIYAGAVDAILPVADTASNIVATDVNDNNNGEDLQVDFIKAADEATLSEYRILVVKSINADTFDLTAAEAVAAANYMAVTPTGSNISTILTATSNDVDGDAIMNGVQYKVFVLSIADGTNATINALSDTSNAITLINTTDIQTLNFVSNVYPNPVSDFLNIELQESDQYNIKITDLSGKELLVKNINGSSTTIDISDLTKSTYILSISNGKYNFTKSIVIN